MSIKFFAPLFVIVLALTVNAEKGDQERFVRSGSHEGGGLGRGMGMGAGSHEGGGMTGGQGGGMGSHEGSMGKMGAGMGGGRAGSHEAGMMGRR